MPSIHIHEDSPNIKKNLDINKEKRVLIDA